MHCAYAEETAVRIRNSGRLSCKMIGHAPNNLGGHTDARTRSHHWKGEYVWTVHARACVKLGIPQSVFDAIRAGQEPGLDNERERAVYDLARIAMEPGAGPDEVFARAERLLGRNGIAEVLALLGYYSSVAMGVKLHRVPVPA